MAIERKKITLPPSTNCQVPDELDKLMNDGWEVKAWRFDAMTNCAQYLLERVVPELTKED